MLRLPLSVLAIIVLGAVMSCGGGDGARSPAEPTPTPLATVFPPRPSDQLTMCVDTVEATREFQVEAVERIGAAMVQVTQHSRYGQAYTSGKEPIIDSGCPAPPILYDPVAYDGATPGSLVHLVGRFVERPGYYAQAVFVIEASEIERIGAEYDLGLISLSEEYTCEFDVCTDTTEGLYLSPTQLEDTAFLVDALEKKIGLEEYGDPIEPGYHPDPLPWR